MNFRWKNRLTTVTLCLLLISVFFYSHLVEKQPVADLVGFLFVFISLIVLFPLTIPHETVQPNPYRRRSNLRGPPK
ncbi:MAG: hypothetical protein GY765_32480 [bacterium]|nr:hypothetical protein [bacterium]